MGLCCFVAVGHEERVDEVHGAEDVEGLEVGEDDEAIVEWKCRCVCDGRLDRNREAWGDEGACSRSSEVGILVELHLFFAFCLSFFLSC